MLIDALPVDVLSLIAEHIAAIHPRGPPHTLYAAFLQSNRNIANAASPHLAHAVFRIQFDSDAIRRRFPSSSFTPSVVAKELVRRWKSLARIRWAASRGPAVWGDPDLYPLPSIEEDMWTAYLMLLEHDTKNWDQLVGWAMLPAYVQAFVEWDLKPASLADEYPQDVPFRSLGLWLLSFLSDKRASRSSISFRNFRRFRLTRLISSPTGNALREIDRHPWLTRLIRPVAFASYAVSRPDSFAHHFRVFTLTFSLPRLDVLVRVRTLPLAVLRPRPNTHRPQS